MRGLIAMALLVGVVLSGCTPVADFVVGAKDAALKPVTGQCWRSSYAHAIDNYNWGAGDSVPCWTSHQLYTYAVVAVSSSAQTWGSSSGDIDQTIDDQARSACHTHYLDLVTQVPPDARVIEVYFVPSESQWRAGARWIRCDLGVLKIGSSFEHPSFSTLPSQISVLVTQIAEHRGQFADCVLTTDSSGNLGPYDDPKATIADCTKNYQWRMQNFFSMGTSDSYPSDDEISAIDQLRCGDQAPSPNDWVTYVPTREQWSSGDHLGECWFFNESLPQA
jgi:hypothetical protein